MAQTLEQFAAACRRVLESDPGPEGRKKVCALVQDMLKAKALTDADYFPKVGFSAAGGCVSSLRK